MFHRSLTFIVWSLLLLVLAACAGTATDPGAATPTGVSEPGAVDEIVIENVSVQLLESFPVQANAVVQGTLPDACSFIESVSQAQEGNSFRITFTMARHPNMRCAPSPTPFEEVVPLDIEGLPAGEYTVQAGGTSSTFELP